ncbi:unnamed protein product [Prunus brigantina]
MVALVLDPRYKLENLDFVLKRRFEIPQDATKKNEVKELLMKLYEEYAIPPPPTTQSTSSTISTTITSSNKKRRRKAPLGNEGKFDKRILSK